MAQRAAEAAQQRERRSEYRTWPMVTIQRHRRCIAYESLLRVSRAIDPNTENNAVIMRRGDRALLTHERRCMHNSQRSMCQYAQA